MPLTSSGADELGLGPAANFCGAYIENPFSELQETWIDLHRGDAARVPATPLASADTFSGRRPLEPIARVQSTNWWFETTFELPFLHQIGAEPGSQDHTLAVFPMLRPQQIRKLKAWINGSELAVQNYAYPRNRKLGCHYADLVGTAAHGGRNRLVVFLSFEPRK